MPNNVEKAYKTPTSLVFSTHNHLPSTYIKITGIKNHWLLVAKKIFLECHRLPEYFESEIVLGLTFSFVISSMVFYYSKLWIS